MTTYFILGFTSIKREKIVVYDYFLCYIVLSIVAKILFTIISA